MGQDSDQGVVTQQSGFDKASRRPNRNGLGASAGVGIDCRYGARAVGLPLPIIEQLGLPPTRKVTVTLSDGSRQERQLYGELRIQVGDRDDVFSCVAKPEGVPLLLGQIVLEALDLVVDCGRQRLIPNPEAPDGMMLYEDY